MLLIVSFFNDIYQFIPVVYVVSRYFMLSFLPRSLSGKGIRMKIVVKETEQEASSYVAEIIGNASRDAWAFLEPAYGLNPCACTRGSRSQAS